MADSVDRPRCKRRGLLRDLVSRAIAEHIVADAPDDYDEVMETVPVAPGRVRILVFLAALAFSWALIIFVAIGLYCSVSKSKPRRVAPGAPYVRRDRPAPSASGRPPVRSGLRPASPASAA